MVQLLQCQKIRLNPSWPQFGALEVVQPLFVKIGEVDPRVLEVPSVNVA